MNKLTMKCTKVVFIIFIILAALPSAILADSGTPSPGLKIIGDILIKDMSPGQTYVDPITVSSVASLDMQVEACGLGQSTDGSIQYIKAQDDTSPYSGRSFISNIDETSFNLQPGVPQNINVTIAVPAGTSPGERYADIYLHSQPVGQGQVGVVVAANIPIIINVPGNTASPAGEITDLSVPESEAGTPIEIDTTFKNTGTTRIQAEDTVVITDQFGKVISQSETPVTAMSIIPTFSRLFAVTPQITNPSQSLVIGQYLVESKITLADGTLLDSKQISFNLTEATTETSPIVLRQNVQSNANFLLPGMYSSSLVIANFNNQQTPYVDATKQADTEVTLTGASGSGNIIVGKYNDIPNTSKQFSALTRDGGTGEKAIKYVDVRVNGFTQGTARIAVHFTDDEISNFNPNSLFLAYFDGNQWHKLDNMTVYNQADYMTGEVSISALSGTIIGLGGESSSNALVSQTSITPVSASSSGFNWMIAGIIIAGILVVGAIIIVVIIRLPNKNNRNESNK
jgi:hypothetical protein